jgi:hypothetical protein
VLNNTSIQKQQGVSARLRVRCCLVPGHAAVERLQEQIKSLEALEASQAQPSQASVSGEGFGGPACFVECVPPRRDAADVSTAGVAGALGEVTTGEAMAPDAAVLSNTVFGSALGCRHLPGCVDDGGGDGEAREAGGTGTTSAAMAAGIRRRSSRGDSQSGANALPALEALQN